MCIHEIAPDYTLALAAAASVLLTLLLFGVAPGIQAMRKTRVCLTGRAVTASRRAAGISLTLIGVELALAAALLIGSGLMGKALWQLANVDSGVRNASVITAKISAAPTRCSTKEN